jgi:superfamily I DNA/RNA helicase
MGVSGVTVRTFSGGAGCGKTYQLMLALREYLLQTPLKEGQKVLALTFMHGSRRRLDERLNSIPELSKKYDCTTIDSFAWRIVRRWLTLAEQLGFGGLAVDQYEKVSDAAASLLEVDVVCKWVAATFPILLVDEAQDLTVERLRIVAALAKHLEMLGAADEFQCLDEQLRPNPTCLWLAQAGAVEDLAVPKRTSVPALLQAASAIRAGNAPVGNGVFQIMLTPNPALAGTFLANALTWYGGGKKVAIITPADGQYARRVTGWVATNTTKKGCGPHEIRWEQSESRAAGEFLNALKLPDESDVAQVMAAVLAGANPRVTTDVRNWLDIQRRVSGRNTFSKEEVWLTVKKSFSNSRRGQRDTRTGFRAMTVHGAKNREFDIAIVLWPAATMGTDDQKRRLLYNAVTRAKQRCLILVQAKTSLQKSPFV